jgi:hypothetical protein
MTEPLRSRAMGFLKSSRFNVQGSTWTRLPVSLNFEPGTLNFRARSLQCSLLDPRCVRRVSFIALTLEGRG